MSLYADASMWANTSKACGSPDQSPINLSQSFAKSCDLLCELSLDDVAVDSAEMIGDTTQGLILTYSSSARPTCKYNGNGYTATKSLMTNPSQHTVEGVQAQAEFITYFSSPQGKTLAISVLVRTSPGDSASTRFFNAFVPFLTQSGEAISVSLGSGWVLGNVVPNTPSYYVYDGSDVVPDCNPVTWIVFADTVNMDPSDFAILAQRIPAGSRPIQQVGGDREVFYNDSEALKGSDAAHMKNDGKVYMKCRRLGTKSTSGPASAKEDTTAVKDSGLLQKKAETEARNIYTSISGTFDSITEPVKNLYAEKGPIGILSLVLAPVLFWFFFFTVQGGEFASSVAMFLNSIFYYLFRYPIEWIFRKPGTTV